MAIYKNKALGQLFMELRFAPREQQEKQLDAAEQFVRIIDRDRDYPFEFVCYRITEYRPRQDMGGVFISGDDLLSDLSTFAAQLRRRLATRVEQVPEPVYTNQQLMKRFGVSQRTIQRWRSRGLPGKLYIFADKRKRIGFTDSAVQSFVHANPDVVACAEGFTQLSQADREKIIQLAIRLRAQSGSSREQIIQQIVGQIGRARETVRYVLKEHDRKNDRQRVFNKRFRTIRTKDIAQIYKLRRQGMTVAELMNRFDRTRSSIYRIINKHRAKELLNRKITFIDSGEFLEEDADKKILATPMETLLMKDGTSVGLLNRDREMGLFRRYNYLKCRVCLLRSQIGKVRPHSSLLNRIEQYLNQAEQIKLFIIEANLRLVVSVASRHLGTGAGMVDLVSEGNMSLMRAVENFDYARGYRFSTYATWAIAKAFARKIPAETARLDKPTTADFSQIPQDMRIGEMVDFEAVERARHSLEAVIENNLNEREQYIVRNHFALDGGPVKRKKKTFKQIGQDLGLSKERVRQLELIALQKLRQNLSSEEFNLLTG